MLNQLHTRLDIKIKNLWKYVGTTAIGESQTPVFFFSFIVVNESAMPSKWHGNDRLLFASPARTIYIPKSTIGISNNPLTAHCLVRLYVLFWCFIIKIMNFTRIRVRIHLLTLSCMYARTLAYSHVRTPTPIPYTMDGKFFGPFHVKYILHTFNCR